MARLARVVCLIFDVQRHEPVPAAVERFDESWALGVVSNSRPEPFDRGVESVLEVHEGAVRPQPQPQIIACNHFPWLTQQHDQHFERLILQADSPTILSEFARPHVEREAPESKSFFDRCKGGEVNHAHLESSILRFLHRPIPQWTGRAPRSRGQSFRPNRATDAQAVG